MNNCENDFFIKYLEAKRNDLENKYKFLEKTKTKYGMLISTSILSFLSFNYLSLIIYNNILLAFILSGLNILSFIPTIQKSKKLNINMSNIKKEIKELDNSVKFNKNRINELSNENEINNQIYHPPISSVYDIYEDTYNVSEEKENIKIKKLK